MARPKNQARQRRALLDAATAVIAELGTSAVSARRVAARAGVSPPSVMYYYPTMDDLVAAVRDDAVQRFCVNRERIAAGPGDAGPVLARLVAAGLPTGADDPLICAIVRMLGTARTDERHARMATEFWERQVAMYERLVSAGAAAEVFAPRLPPRSVAEHLVGLEDAFGAHIVSGNTALGRERAITLVLEYAEAVLGCSLPRG